jgi:hypothetical protein
MTNREKIINHYIEGYNQFDVEKMVTDFDENIIFENISNGETNMLLTGLTAFTKQAREAITYFSTREQTVKSIKHSIDQTEVEISYAAVLAVDFPGGLQKGDRLEMEGKSIFKFQGDKIIKLTDII